MGVLALSGLTGVYFYLKDYNAKQDEAALEAAAGEEILCMETDDLSKISFLLGGEEVTFQKEENGWRLASDETFPVDETALLSPIGQLDPLMAVRVLEDAEDSTEYGMENPQNRIILETQEGETRTITIGDTNDGTGNDYLMVDADGSKIYTVESSLRTAFSDDLYDYAVSEELPELQVSDMIGVSVETESGGYRLYLEDSKWMAADLYSGNAEKAEDVSGGTDETAEKTEDISGGTDETAEKAEEISGKKGYSTGQNADSDIVNDAMSQLGSLSYVDYLEHNCSDGEKYGFGKTVLTIYYQEKAEEIVSEAETEGTVSETETQETASETESEKIASEIETEETVSESAENESEKMTEPQKVTKNLQIWVGSTDADGNYYVQLVGSGEVHTVEAAVLETLLGASAADWIEEEAETE